MPLLGDPAVSGLFALALVETAVGPTGCRVGDTAQGTDGPGLKFARETERMSAIQRETQTQRQGITTRSVNLGKRA